MDVSLEEVGRALVGGFGAFFGNILLGASMELAYVGFGECVIRRLLHEGWVYVWYDEFICLRSQSQKRVWGIHIRCRRK